MKTNYAKNGYDKATARVIASMLRENTGRHLLDSGGAYGRNWERNQARAFENEPRASCRFAIYGTRWECEFTINVYHFLCENLRYDAAMQVHFDRYAKRNDPENDKSWFALVDAFVESLNARGLYGESGPMTINTYNGEDALSQVIQYTYFETDDGDFVALMIHDGCDVRGGYTAPKFFQTRDETGIFDNARGTLYCANGHRWDTYNAGYKWEPVEDEINLGAVDFVALDEMTDSQREKMTAVQEWYKYADKMDALPIMQKTYPRLNLLVIDNDTHIGYCPMCASEIHAHMF